MGTSMGMRARRARKSLELREGERQKLTSAETVLEESGTLGLDASDAKLLFVPRIRLRGEVEVEEGGRAERGGAGTIPGVRVGKCEWVSMYVVRRRVVKDGLSGVRESVCGGE